MSKREDNIFYGCSIFMVLALAILLSILLSGCKTKYIPVERTRVIETVIHDTVIDIQLEKESVFVQTKDTFAFAETKYAEAKAGIKYGLLSLELRNKSNMPIQIETKYIETIIRDSIPVPYPQEVIKKVEKELSWWQGIKMEAGGIALGALFLIIVYFIIKIIISAKTIGLKAAVKSLF